MNRDNPSDFTHALGVTDEEIRAYEYDLMIAHLVEIMNIEETGYYNWREKQLFCPE